MRMNRGNHCLIALILGCVLAFPVMAKEGMTERERALEERITELENMVRQLMRERVEVPDPSEEVRDVREEVAKVREEVERLEAEKAPRVTSGINARLAYGGFIKHDMMSSRYSGGSIAPGSVGRDFHVPALIPVGGESSTTDFDTHIRESRFWFNATADSPTGAPLQAYLEFDFSAQTGGDERLTNATSPSIRHAFVRYDNRFLAGQFWSAFFNVAALTENLDFVGPAEGTLFIRQPQIRFMSGPWEISFENPETTVTPFGGGARIVTDTSNIPDIVVRYNHSGEWGHFSAAALGRQLGIGKTGPGGSDRELGLALSLSGKFDIGRNDIRWMVSGGPGIGRYIGLNTTNDAVLDANGELEAIDAYGGFIGYRHFWNDQWRSNFTLSGLWIDNDTDLTGFGVTKEAQSAHVNLIYQYNPSLRFGIEYQIARREIESGAQGNMNRVQFSTILAF